MNDRRRTIEESQRTQRGGGRERPTSGVCAKESGGAGVGRDRLAALTAWRETGRFRPVRRHKTWDQFSEEMKCTIPEISWHNRDPVLSIDVQPSRKTGGDGPRRLASGGTDSHVLIWYIRVKESGQAEVEFASDLQRHQRAVNVVRFSPSGELLASGDDESVIIVWKLKSELDAPELPTNEPEVNRENWITIKVLRGHLEDVYDLSWSPDSLSLISGSVDNSAVLWDVHKGKALHILKEHTGFVQGVTWDPKNQYVATMSSDRTCRIYSLSSKRVVHHVSKAQLPVAEGSSLEGKVVRLFHDDTLKSFFRRLCFTPDGELLVVPSGLVEVPDSGQQFNATFIFTRNVMKRPVLYLPSPDQYTVAVRCCPRRFRLHPSFPGVAPVFSLPYRLVLAVATQSSVVLYDTQQPEPFGLVSNIHYTRLTDLSWSCDGQVLVVSSTDGYCSIITFADGELGDIYEETSLTPPDMAEQKQQEVTPQKGCPPSPVQEQLCEQQQQSSSSSGRTPRRIQLITLSSPKSTKRLPQ